MVKLLLLIPIIICSFSFIDNHYSLQNKRYENIFNNASLCASFKSIEISEEDNVTARFNKSLLDYYFHICWEKLSSVTPTKYSIVTFDDFGISDKYGTSVQIKIQLELDFKTYLYDTQYDIEIRGESNENK